jgi:heat shock protein HslJ
VPVPESYTIEFNGDDTYEGMADCNSIAGAYSTGDDGTLTIEQGPSTLVACPEGSLGDVFIASLSQAASYSIEGSTLTLTLTTGATMEFIP